MLIRIQIDEGSQIDWNVPSPEQISFSEVLEAIYQASGDQLLVTAFGYIDEEEDLITVKNDRDLHSMIQFHLSSNQSKGFLSIYPKLCRNPGKRNKFGLKVNIAQPVRLKTPLTIRESQLTNQPTKNEGKVGYGTQNTASGAVSKNTNYEIGSSMEERGKNENIENESLSNSALTFLETLGNGNSGIVYKVVHKTTNILMAVKSIPIDLTEQQQDSIKSELAILGQCNNSPQIIDFYGAYFDDGRVFFCTEYMDGGSLDRYGKIPEVVLRRVSHRVVSGLQYLWSKRIMHRDVKPSNMLVNTRGQVKLCDFGVSRQLVNSIVRTYVGTNAYMAPERVAGCEYTIYSDIWSLGLSICEMAVGHFPYPELALKMRGPHGLVPMEVMQCIVNDAPPFLPTGKFSPQIIDFVKCCLQKEAKCRPSPDVLCQHPFLSTDQISDFGDDLIVDWIKQSSNSVKQ